MTAGEEDYPPPLPRNRRPLSEPPDPGADMDAVYHPAEPGPLDDPSLPDNAYGAGHGDSRYADGRYADGRYADSSHDGRYADGRAGAAWFDEPGAGSAVPPNAPMPATGEVPTITSTGQFRAVNDHDGSMGHPRMPGSGSPLPPVPMQHGSADHMGAGAVPTGRNPAVGGSGDHGRSGFSGGAYGQGRPRSGPFGGLRSGPLPVVGAVAALVVAAGLIGWMFRGSGSGQEITLGGDAADVGQGAVDDGADGADAADLPPLSPAALPSADENGLVGLELALIDPYTGTGSTGTAELYLNALTGEVCHQFDSPALDGRYRAYIHEAEFPKAGPIVVDLGEVANSVPRCVNASPIDLTRALANNEGFYVAAHAGEREIVLRAQLSAASTVFDNRDPALVASQEAAAAGGGDGDGGLFGSAEEGAYLVVESGKVSFEGMVPDEQTADQLRAAFIALSGMGVEVVDNLMVQAGAPAPSGKVIVADALLFGSGQDQISGDPAVLATLADLMIVNPTWTMTITGHTDDVGPYSFNIELSLRRANNIRTRLDELGVPPERIRVQGAGPEQPIDDNSTEEGRARNRRIEISIDS